MSIVQIIIIREFHPFQLILLLLGAVIVLIGRSLWSKDRGLRSSKVRESN